MQPKQVELWAILRVSKHQKCLNWVMNMMRSMLVDCCTCINEFVQHVRLVDAS
jgi:hypothetical protein